MKTSENITVTDARLRNALKSEFNYSISPEINAKISQVAQDLKLQIGVMTKFYPYLDKAEIRLKNNKLILCKILHRFTGNLIDFFTPDGEEDFCDKLKEPCIIPRSELECLILDINDNTDMQILVGFINSEELIGFNPAKKGSLKLVDIEGTNQYWIKFGGNGLDIRLPDQPSAEVGDLDSNMSCLEYVQKGTFENTVVELNKKIEEIPSGGSGINFGSFYVNNEGHLIAVIPSNINPYRLDDDGHLYYNTGV